MGLHFYKKKDLRWAPSLAVSVFLAGLLIATACSADCLGLRCALGTPAPMPNHDGAGPQHHHGMPSHDSSKQDNSGDCGGHGLNLVFDRAPAKLQFAKVYVAAPEVAVPSEAGDIVLVAGPIDPVSHTVLLLPPPGIAEVLRI